MKKFLVISYIVAWTWCLFESIRKPGKRCAFQESTRSVPVILVLWITWAPSLRNVKSGLLDYRYYMTGEQTLVEKDSPSWRTTKSSFFSRSAHFGDVSPFLVGATNTFSELIHPFVKLPNCILKQQPQILQFVRSARLFRLSPSSRSRHRLCCRTATSTHFWSSTIYTTFYYIHYISP